MMFFSVYKHACSCLGQRRTYATSRLLSFSTQLHYVFPCFLHLLPHMQHESSVNSPAGAKNCASTLKEFTACELCSFKPWRLVNCNGSSVLEQSKLCENVLPRRPHWLRTRSGEMLVVGGRRTKCLAANLIPVSVSKHFRQVGQCNKTALCQGSNKKQLHNTTSALLCDRANPPKPRLTTRSDRTASGSWACTPTKGMR